MTRDYSTPELAGFDPNVAAGILARAALALESDDTNPEAKPIQKDELLLRETIIKRVSHTISEASDPMNTALRSEIADWLDNAAVLISAPEDDQAALQRLSREAALPSDAYEIIFDLDLDKIEQLVGFEERDAVRGCIKQAQFSEEFNTNSGPNSPEFISIFGKLVGEYNDRSRYMLVVVAERTEIKLVVKHYWRIYNSDVPLYPIAELTSLLREFAAIFGSDFMMNDWKGRFLLFKKFPGKINTMKIVPMNDGEPGDIYAGCIVTRILNGYFEAAIGININVTKYKKTLRRR